MIAIHGTPDRVTVSGHAEYAPPGQDIVCAAVSALAQTLALSVRMVAGDHATVTTGDGLLDIKLHTANDITKALISAFFIGVKEIEKQYPANVRVLSEP